MAEQKIGTHTRGKITAQPSPGIRHCTGSSSVDTTATPAMITTETIIPGLVAIGPDSPGPSLATKADELRDELGPGFTGLYHEMSKFWDSLITSGVLNDGVCQSVVICAYPW